MTYRKLARIASVLTLLLAALLSAIPAAVAAASTPVFKSAVSRRLHAGVAYDIPLPQSGAGGIECRQLTSGMTVVVNFDQPITAGNAAVSAGAATVASAMPSGNSLVVNLNNVGDAQTVTLVLSNVTAASGGTPATVVVYFRVLGGDVNGSGIVTASDVAIVKFNSGL